ncbi:hypothetical protein FRB99_000311 [Tulasnella sp. 403]|nr:hypothetical protein FRB99_000311 [Tulasnella sp. 403]
MFSLPPLPDLPLSIVDENELKQLPQSLPLVYPRFFVPALEDKPQDPIIRTLQEQNRRKAEEERLSQKLNIRLVTAITKQDEDTEQTLSGDASSGTWQNLSLSWDELTQRSTPTVDTVPSAFVSEQKTKTFEAVVKHLLPQPIRPTKALKVSELREILQTLVFGDSSSDVPWNPLTEQFGSPEDAPLMVVDGLTPDSTQGLISQFIAIGTCLRRLETFALYRRAMRNCHEMHAIVHCVHVTLTYVRNQMAENLPSEQLLEGHARYAAYCDLLQSLARFCRRGYESTPPYYPLPETPQGLLDHRAKVQVARGIKSLNILRHARPEHPVCQYVLGEQEQVTGWVWTAQDVEHRASWLERHLTVLNKRVHLWQAGTEERRTLAADQFPSPGIPVTIEETPLDSADPTPTVDEGAKYKPEISDFRKFDLEPGAHLKKVVDPVEKEVSKLRRLIQSFPEHLPAGSPTLFYLIQTTVVDPLAAHCRLLSSSLLDLHFNDLHLLTHFDVLRRFMLFGDARFVANLRAALFDEGNFTDDPSLDGSGMQPSLDMQIWGVGLNRRLSTKGEWPPDGYSLSHSLRSVIYRALDGDDDERADDSREGERKVLQEAEWRMGFIIRKDHDEGEDEQVSWADPMSIQALGFLRLQYRPPSTLDLLINADVMDKYQRVFDFLLCLLRADSVARANFATCFNKTPSKTNPFSTNPKAEHLSRRINQHMQSFLSALIAYIFDSAIGSHWTTFTRRLQSLRRDTPSESPQTETDERDLHDVFSIADYHSETLDKILTACLLKSRHQAAGAALRKPLALILALGKLLRDAHTLRIGREGAFVKLTQLDKAWGAAILNLIKHLQSLDERGIAKRSSVADLRELHALAGGAGSAPLGPGDLLLRLDPYNWYSKATTNR